VNLLESERKLCVLCFPVGLCEVAVTGAIRSRRPHSVKLKDAFPFFVPLSMDYSLVFSLVEQ
jgi:hypothetical protein